jgi:hypothetical protein|tara:strand:- start:102 stop:281 length:180 start_codon:yes stop_codon:yes gene_type:complete
MKDIYKQKVSNSLDSCINKSKVVREMVTGERPADPKTAGSYLQQVEKSLEEIKEFIERG